MRDSDQSMQSIFSQIIITHSESIFQCFLRCSFFLSCLNFLHSSPCTRFHFHHIAMFFIMSITHIEIQPKQSLERARGRTVHRRCAEQLARASLIFLRRHPGRSGAPRRRGRLAPVPPAGTEPLRVQQPLGAAAPAESEESATLPRAAPDARRQPRGGGDDLGCPVSAVAIVVGVTVGAQ